MQHPDKTFIGRISRGFDFLGYTFTPAGLDVAPQTVERCVERLSRLYEQDVDLFHIGAYVRRWLRWTKIGLGERGERLAWPERWLRRLDLGGLWLHGRCGPSFPAFVSYDVDATAY
ncbi:MAG: hypothetical protein WBC80_25380, partial [Isosphaeraceae bacterium]